MSDGIRGERKRSDTMRRMWAGFLVVSVLAAMWLLTGCKGKELDTVSADTYAKIEEADGGKLVLRLGRWENGRFSAVGGETTVAQDEILSITTSGGEAVVFEQLRPGSVVRLYIETNVKTDSSKINVQLVE